MKLKHLHALLFLCCSMIIFSCKKDIDKTVVDPPVDNSGFNIPAATPVTGRISGIVVDENNDPVQNAEVVLAGTSYTTDAKGFFHINNSTLDKYITTVTVNKTGYFKAIRAFSATESRNYLSIKLIPKQLAGTFDAAGGGSAGLSNGTVLTFQGNGIVIKGTNTAYSGTVNVYASYIDPTATGFGPNIPGSLMGQDAEHMFVLQSTGMIAVDLESTSGQALQLATGKTANIKLPVPASLLSKAPATIDTWSLDDRGIWIKEGTATRNGNFYEMQVSHFSFWNCDVPANAIYLTINVHDQNGNPLSNTWVDLTIPNNTTWWGSSYGLTDSSGTVAGLVPSNQALEMEISPNIYSCITPIASQNIGPFSSDTTINITVTLTPGTFTVISGTVNGCNNQPLDSGAVFIYGGYYSSYTASISNGTYTITIPSCSSLGTVYVTAYDYTGGSTTSSTVTVTGTNVTVPTMTLCNTNQNATYAPMGCQVFGTYDAGMPVNSTNYFMAVVSVMTTGNYQFSATSNSGVYFSASGVFDHVGLDTVYMQAAGTPAWGGTYSVEWGSGGQVCTSTMVVNGATGPTPAVFDLGQGVCSGAIINGVYASQQPLNIDNNIIIQVNVTSPGSYNIFTTTQNGITFQDSGYFTSTGMMTVVLQGWGTPNLAGTHQYQLFSNGVAGCVFDITTGPPAPATFGTCVNYNVGGVYTTGVALNGQNTVTVMIEVTSPGYYNIVTNTVNGIGFVAAGVFTQTGLQPMVFTASGTPTAPGTYTFGWSTPTGSGCPFTITVN
ncbi:MAG: carboxypeptidase-like regulatory domain-containing protein [Ferruginibacter sp.]